MCPPPFVGRYLLHEHGINPGVTDRAGCTPLMHAAATGSLQCVQLLLDEDPPIDLHATDHKVRPPARPRGWPMAGPWLARGWPMAGPLMHMHMWYPPPCYGPCYKTLPQHACVAPNLALHVIMLL